MPAHAGITAALTLVTLTALLLATRTLRNTRRPPAAVLVAALAAAACTAYSADTSWRFARDHLSMTSLTERAGMFAAAELALFSLALMARQNLRTTGAPGTPGFLVWVVTGVQIIPAYSESGPIGGTVRAFVGPALAALLWHLAMGIELRHHTPGANSQALWALLVREARERLMSRLGLAVRDRTAEQITRDRWTQRAVTYAARLAQLGPAPAGRLDRRRAVRLARRLTVAVGRAHVGASAEQRQMLLSLLAARRHATALATMDLASPWDADTVRPAGPPRTTDEDRGQQADTPPVLPGGQPRTAPGAHPDITADARADKGADTPLSSTDTVRALSADTTPDKPTMAAIVRTCLDAGADTPEQVVSAVRRVLPDADIPTVKRTLRRERARRTDYL
jgi:hypothetical protein